MHKHTKSLLIEGVAPGSIADEFELQAGDRLLAVNGHRLRDLIDYSYYTSSEQELLLDIARADGEFWELEIERELGEALGLTFAPTVPARLPQQLHLLLRPPAPPRAAQAALRQGRGLPPLLPQRQLRHPGQHQRKGTEADHRAAPLAAVHLGPRHRSRAA